MHWIDANDELPMNGQAVLVRYSRNNWEAKHTLSNGKEYIKWRWQAARFIEGQTAEQVKKSGRSCKADQAGNNLKPYCWEEFGPGCLFGQDVSHWAAISDPLNK